MRWVEAISRLSRANQAFATVTVLATRGSSPRGGQTKMVVTSSDSYDSIGGGQLEFEAIRHARAMISSGQACLEKLEYTLGKDLTQCCGGEIELLYEHFPACDFQVVLYGAGHVGQALITILADCPCRVRWLDSRETLLETAMRNCGDPSNVVVQKMTNPFESIEQNSGNAFHLIMTHSHEIDFELCEAILGAKNIRFCGLIGSQSKASSFAGRLKRKGFSEAELTKLTSPLGLPLGRGKLPMEVAVSIAGQLLQLYYEGADSRK